MIIYFKYCSEPVFCNAPCRVMGDLSGTVYPSGTGFSRNQQLLLPAHHAWFLQADRLHYNEQQDKPVFREWLDEIGHIAQDDEYHWLVTQFNLPTQWKHADAIVVFRNNVLDVWMQRHNIFPQQDSRALFQPEQ